MAVNVNGSVTMNDMVEAFESQLPSAESMVADLTMQDIRQHFSERVSFTFSGTAEIRNVGFIDNLSKGSSFKGANLGGTVKVIGSTNGSMPEV